MSHLVSRNPFTSFIRRRLDHGPMYMCVVVGLLCGAIYILWHWNAPTPIFSWLSLGTENFMAATQLLGCLGCIFGMVSGTRFFRPGADLRDIYTIGKWSILPLVVAFGTLTIGAVVTKFFFPLSEVMLLVYGVNVGLILVALEFHAETTRLNAELRRRLEINKPDLPVPPGFPDVPWKELGEKSTDGP